MHVKDIRETPELLTTELFSLSSPIVYFLKVVFMVGIELIYNWWSACLACLSSGFNPYLQIN